MLAGGRHVQSGKPEPAEERLRRGGSDGPDRPAQAPADSLGDRVTLGIGLGLLERQSVQTRNIQNVRRWPAEGVDRISSSADDCSLELLGGPVS